MGVRRRRLLLFGGVLTVVIALLVFVLSTEVVDLSGLVGDARQSVPENPISRWLAVSISTKATFSRTMACW